jgi:tetratricopeptide (TPR) repeat protein
MSTILDDPKRRTIPRWRPWEDAVLLGQADVCIKLRSPRKPNPAEVTRAKIAWEANRSVPFAGDFMGVAYSLGEYHVAKEAAEFILKTKSPTSKAARDLARVLLSKPGGGDGKLFDPPLMTETDRHQRIRKLRALLRSFPRNPLIYMDLALEYVALGQHSSAIEPVKIALALAPNCRFVLRSASRFFLHLNDPKEAHRLLRGSDRVKMDPWLLAAEIAVASAGGRTSKFIKTGHRLIESKNYDPAHISELASSLGTLECEGGSARLVKRLFQRALIKPTENVVAQAGWVSRQIGNLNLAPEVLETPRSYEAQAWAHMLASKWTDSVAAAELWLRDEPFAKRPAVFGSWAAAATLSNFELAERLARHGLMTHPDELLLLNNLAVSLARMGKTGEAIEVFERINPDAEGGLYKTTYWATNGLIKFRLGMPEEGRRLYRMAIEEARRKRDIRTIVTALLYFAREEARFDPTRADKLREEAVAEFPKLPTPQQTIAARILELSFN